MYTATRIAGALVAAVGLAGCDRPTNATEPGTTTLEAEHRLAGSMFRTALRRLEEGRHIFRFDTFGDESFWGDTLGLHRAIEGAAHGGVGPGVSPKTALAVGLKVDAQALPGSLVRRLKRGEVDLDSPATTLALLKLNAVVGLTGFFQADGSLR